MNLEDGEVSHLIRVKVLVLLYLCIYVFSLSFMSEDDVSHLIRVKVLILLLHHLRSWDPLLFKLAFCLDLLW